MWECRQVQMAKRTGAVIEVIPEDEEGDISLSALEALITQGPRKPALIAITHVPTNSGSSFPEPTCCSYEIPTQAGPGPAWVFCACQPRRIAMLARGSTRA